jgi:RecB family endonuclease NucS
VDALLENGEYVMAVEIKSVVSQHDVDEHLERLERVRKEMNKRKDYRKLVGTVAGMVVEEKARRYAQDKGLYVLAQSGNSVEVAGAQKTFQAREW